MKIKSISIVLLIVAIVFACRKDISQPVSQNANVFLTEAKSFYYKETQKLGITSVAKQASGNEISKVKSNNSVTPQWYKSYISKAGNNVFTEVPIIKSQKIISLYNFAKKATSESINLARANSSFKRLLIYKTKRGNFHQIQLTYVPDYDYLEKIILMPALTKLIK